MCSKPDCGKPLKAMGLCSAHYTADNLRRKNEGDSLRPDRRKTYTHDELEDYWLWVKKELGLV